MEWRAEDGSGYQEASNAFEELQRMGFVGDRSTGQAGCVIWGWELPALKGCN